MPRYVGSDLSVRYRGADVVARYRGADAAWPYAVGGFDTASLFGPSDDGMTYDPSYAGTVFQDAAGTTPATTDSQPIGRLLDRSGNGYHLQQPTASRRPLYRTDGTRYRISSDGIDDWMDVLWAGGRDTLTIAVAGHFDTGSSNNSRLLSFSPENAVDWNTVGAGGIDTTSGGLRFGIVRNTGTATFMNPNTPGYFLVETDGAGHRSFGPNAVNDTNVRWPINNFVRFRLFTNPFGSELGRFSLSHVTVIDRALTETERTEMLAFLAAKGGGAM